MAKATAICHCSQCGATFERTNTCRNCKAADDWKTWAERTFDECPQCYIKRMREEEAAKPLTLNVSIDPYSQRAVLVFSGATLPNKDQIKGLGYRWEETPASGVLGTLIVDRPPLAWSKCVHPESVDSEVKAAEAIGAVIQSSITDADLYAYQEIKSARDAKEAAVQAEIDTLDKPVQPECYPAGRWNGKIYGNSKYGYRIYVDGVETKISEEENAALESYQSGTASFRFSVLDGIVFFLSRFGSMAWNDSPYALQLSRQASFPDVPDAAGYALTCLMADADDCTIRALRLIGLGTEFSRKFRAAVITNGSAPLYRPEYMRSIQRIYQQYTTNDMVRLSQAKFTVSR